MKHEQKIRNRIKEQKIVELFEEVLDVFGTRDEMEDEFREKLAEILVREIE